MGAEIRSWALGRRSEESLDDLAGMFTKRRAGWINYYGRCSKSESVYLLRRLNGHLVRWATRKYYKRLRNKERDDMAGRDRQTVSPAVRALATRRTS